MGRAAGGTRGASGPAALLLLAPALLLAAPAEGAAGGPDLGGYVKGFAYQEVYAPHHLDRAGARLQLRLAGGDAAPVAWFAAVDFELDSRLLAGGDTTRGAAFDVYPVELWLELVFDTVEVRIGQQYVIWGRTTFTSPTDVLTPWDYVNMASEIEDQRIAPLGVRAAWYPGAEVKLEAVWLPVFTASRLPLAAPGSMGPVPVVELGEQRPDTGLGNGEFGLRLSEAVSAWAFDWAVSAYRGWDKRPVPQVTPVLAGTPPAPAAFEWAWRYQRLTLVGADLAKALGPFVIKGEGAMKWGEDGAGDDPLLTNDRLEWVAAADWTASSDVTLGLEYVGSHRLAYDREAERAALAALGRPDPWAPAATSHTVGITGRVELAADLSAQATALYGLTHEDLFGLGFVAWTPADALSVALGGVLFGGPEDTPFGRQRDLSRVFAEVKYSF